MGNQINEKPKKQRVAAVPQDLSNRVTALENTGAAQHSEIMRMLADMSNSMKDSFKMLSSDVRDQAIKQATQDERITTSFKEIKRIDTKLNKIMGGIGAVALTIVGGIFTLAARYFGR
jgi:GTP cyclohydrolase III